MTAPPVAIVTGAGSGIGRATAVRLARDGARVAVCDVVADAARATCDLITGAGQVARPFAVDISNAAAVDAMVAEVTASLGPPTGLVNSAGIFGLVDLAELDAERFARMMSVNVMGTLHAMQAVLPTMAAQGGGAIVNLASVAADAARPRAAHYAASKAAVVSVTRSAAIAWIRQGVRVNCVSPSAAATEMTARAVAGGGSLQGDDDRLPIGRMARAEEIASVIAFLLSDDASYVVGQVINVCGGLTAIDAISGPPR